ncbi:response regulator transcription factor [Cerasicoccus frondis]|uniref:response regulator transcription factor n=1 Tax=Cerasicoccus frondis TaxID=490090 RepID=UPI002852BD5E|nr:response regulator transcription factor [Cerasicoccus frondis]
MAKDKTILVAEDDASIRLGLVDTLESEGYGVEEAVNGEEAVALFHDVQPDLVLLDIMMPRLSGYDVCREIRKSNAVVPVLMLSAKSEEIDKVLGLELGADDYITKPFGVRELLARVSAALRRSKAAGASVASSEVPAKIQFGLAELDTALRQLWLNGEGVPLTQLEYKLLMAFHQHPDRALSRDFLLNAAWGIDYLGTTRTLDQHVSQLRRKVEADSAKPQFLLTVHGYGYRYKPPVNPA